MPDALRYAVPLCCSGIFIQLHEVPCLQRNVAHCTAHGMTCLTRLRVPTFFGARSQPFGSQNRSVRSSGADPHPALSSRMRCGTQYRCAVPGSLSICMRSRVCSAMLHIARAHGMTCLTRLRVPTRTRRGSQLRVFAQVTQLETKAIANAAVLTGPRSVVWVASAVSIRQCPLSK